MTFAVVFFAALGEGEGFVDDIALRFLGGETLAVGFARSTAVPVDFRRIGGLPGPFLAMIRDEMRDRSTRQHR